MDDTDPSQGPPRADDDDGSGRAPARGGGAGARYESGRLSAGARKAVLAVLVVVVIAAGIGVAFWYYKTLGGTDLTAQAVRYDTVDASTATADISLTRDDPQDPAVCVIRARNTDGAEVGRREVYFPPSPHDDTVVSTEIATSGRSGVVEVYGCSYTIPAYLDTRAG